MKYTILFFLCLVMANSVFAASCPDVSEAAGSAMQQRNQRVSETHNTLMPDPEEDRGTISNCLSSVNAIGAAFTLGVTMPDMDQILGEMCKDCDSFIQGKINDAHNQVLNSVNGMGGNNPFKVYGTGGDYVLQIKDKLK